MKAVCVLLCLTLARLTAGHIFRRQHYPQNMELIVQPLNYIDQNQLNQQQELTPGMIQASTLQGQYRPRQQEYQSQRKKHQQQESQQSQLYQEIQGSQRNQWGQNVNKQNSDSTSKESNSKESRESVRINQQHQQNSDSTSKESQRNQWRQNVNKQKSDSTPQESQRSQWRQNVNKQKSDSTSKESNSKESRESVRVSQQQQQNSDSNSNEGNSKESRRSVHINQYAKPMYADTPPMSKSFKSSRQNKNSQESQETQRYQLTQRQKVNKQNSDSTSNESNSKESRESVSNSQYAVPMNADALTMTKNLKSSHQNMKPAYGDVIAWNGIRIANSPINPVTQKDIEKIFNDAYTTMTHVNKENKKIFHQTFEAAAESVNEDATLNASQLLQKNNYPVEEHMIKTDDGYFLTLFRIPAKDQTLDVQKPVVFLMHGLLGSADDWLLMGPGKSLAYLLADAGYDVWLGNARGSKYSRYHASKHPALADFWQYSIDEIALNDLPTMIDYALKTSNQDKLYYVAHSLGTTAFFALAATRPEYNEKIIMMYALAPMVYMNNVRSPLLRMIAPNSPFYELLHKQLGHGRFKPSVELINLVGGQMLENKIGCKNVSSNVNFVMSGVNVDNMEADQIPVIMRHLPAGASARLIKQYGQAVASQWFAKYDFGAELNEKVYGTRQPPKYEMRNVQAPVSLYYSEEDWLASPKDIQRLETELPNVKDSYKVMDPHFAHMDFQFGKNAPEEVYKRLIESMNNRQSQRSYVY